MNCNLVLFLFILIFGSFKSYASDDGRGPLSLTQIHSGVQSNIIPGGSLGPFSSYEDFLSEVPTGFGLWDYINIRYSEAVFGEDVNQDSILVREGFLHFLAHIVVPFVSYKEGTPVSQNFFQEITSFIVTEIPPFAEFGDTPRDRLRALNIIDNILKVFDFNDCHAANQDEVQFLIQLNRLLEVIADMSSAVIENLEQRVSALERDTIDVEKGAANDSEIDAESSNETPQDEDENFDRVMDDEIELNNGWVGFPESSLKALDSGVMSGDFEEDEGANLTSGVFDSEEGEAEAMVFDLHEQASEDIVTINVKDVLGVGFILGAAVLTAPITGPVVGSAIAVSGLLGWIVLR